MTNASSYRYEFVSHDVFQPILKKYRPEMFGDIVSAKVSNLYTEQDKENQERLNEAFRHRKIYLLAYDGDEVIGWSFGSQQRAVIFHMHNSAVFKNYRRQGIYTHMLQLIMDHAKHEGYEEITSHHHCTNSDVIVAKLKAGFLISGFEIDDKFGILVRLTYFINKEREQLFRFRIGELAIPTDLRQRLDMRVES